MSSGKIIDLRKGKPQRSSPPRPSAPAPWQQGKRVSPVRTKRRRTRLIIFAVIVLVLLGTALGIGYASYLPKYSIESISVSGAQAVSPDAISQYVGSIIYNGSHHFLSRGNIFLYPKALIEKDIVAEFPRISSAQVTRASLLANAITVTVTERQPYALWCNDANTCYQLDQTGFIFAAAPSSATSSGEYIFTGGIATSSMPIGQTVAPGHMPGIVVFLQLLGQAGFTPQGATIESDEDFSVPVTQGFYIEASFGEAASQLVNNLQLVLSSDPLQGQEQNLQYVDLRFGDRVYYKLNGQDQAQTSASGG